jgi:hypothetical protein
VFTLYTVAVVEMPHLVRTKCKGFAVARNFAPVVITVLPTLTSLS